MFRKFRLALYRGKVMACLVRDHGFSKEAAYVAANRGDDAANGFVHRIPAEELAYEFTSEAKRYEDLAKIEAEMGR